MTINKVYVNIRVEFERDHVKGEDWSYLEIKGVQSIASDLTQDEASDVVQDIMESSKSADIINALLDSLAGKDTKL